MPGHHCLCAGSEIDAGQTAVFKGSGRGAFLSVRLRPITLVLLIGGLLTEVFVVVFVLVDTFETGCEGRAEHSLYSEIFGNVQAAAGRRCPALEHRSRISSR